LVLPGFLSLYTGTILQHKSQTSIVELALFHDSRFEIPQVSENMHLSKLFTLAVAILPMALATPVARYPVLEALEQLEAVRLETLRLEALEREALEPETFAPVLVQCFILFIPGVDIVDSCKQYRELSMAIKDS
jgi:hypothetical protein